MKSRLLIQKALIGIALLVAGASVAEPVLHEYFQLNGPPGATPLAVNADEGRATASSSGAPDPQRRSVPSLVGTDVQQGASQSTDSYRLDGNTERPEEVGYEDPFTPSIPPFKRLFAYDAVDSSFELVVLDRTLRRVTIGGSPQPGEDQFFGDLELQLKEGIPERVPNVGPSARLLAARLEPSVDFEIGHDSAENWYITAKRSGTFRFTTHLSIDRRVFGSEFDDPEWSDLSPLQVAVPDTVKHRAQDVAASIGVSQSQRPREVVSRLVAHFRAFAPSEELPSSLDRGALFREIALSRKGVCRHRSYAFLVTALGLGIPSRFVRNEAHAWVEVHDGSEWHRIDLGGAAGEMQFGSRVDVTHVPPQDPFEWPVGSESARDMTDAALSGSTSSGQRGSARTHASPSGTHEQEQRVHSAEPAPSVTENSDHEAREPESGEPTSIPDRDDASDDTEMEREDVLKQPTASLVDVEPHAETVLQGSRVKVSGSVIGENGPCALVRVDIVLESEDRTLPVGTLVTDDRGRYRGEITMPGSVPVGDYQLKVVTRGATECGAGASR